MSEEFEGKLLIRLVVNAEGGEVRKLDVEDGTTLEELLTDEVVDFSWARYKATVNGIAKDNGYELRNGDTVSVVPSKFGGGR